MFRYALEKITGDETAFDFTKLHEGDLALVRHNGGASVSDTVSVGADPGISRNHATISVRGQYCTVLDNSTNGTYLNGAKVPGGEPVTLLAGDIIDCARRFSCRFLDDDPKIPKKTALMVGHSNGDKVTGVINNAHGLRRSLDRRGFKGGVKVLFNDFASLANILFHLEFFLRHSSEDSTFTFYFSGHANEEAELILGNDVLNAFALFGRLGDFRGKVLVILDGCFTESFSRYLPDNCSLIANSEEGYEGPYPTTRGGKLKNRLAGHLTKAIIDVLDENPEGMNLEDLLDKVQIKLKERRGDKAQSITLHSNSDLPRIDTATLR